MPLKDFTVESTGAVQVTNDQRRAHREWQYSFIILGLLEGMTIKSVATITRLNAATIHYLSRGFGINVHELRALQLADKHARAVELADENRMTTKQIADEVGMCAAEVWRALRRANPDRPKRTVRVYTRMSSYKSRVFNLLADLYNNPLLMAGDPPLAAETLRSRAAKHGVSRELASQVHAFMLEHGIINHSAELQQLRQRVAELEALQAQR